MVRSALLHASDSTALEKMPGDADQSPECDETAMTSCFNTLRGTRRTPFAPGEFRWLVPDFPQSDEVRGRRPVRRGGSYLGLYRGEDESRPPSDQPVDRRTEGHTREPCMIAFADPVSDVSHIAESLTSRDYLSWSAISTYLRCPLKYQFHDLDQLPEEFVSANLIFGSAIHAALEAYSGEHLGSRRSLSVDALLAVYHSTWSQAELASVQFGKSEDLASLGALAERMLQAFLASDLSRPNGSIIGIEEELRASVIANCPDLLVRLDLMIETDEAFVVTDFKTARSRWSPGDVNAAEGQLIVYHELVRQFADTPIRLPFVVITKTKQPEIEIQPVIANPARIERIRADWNGSQFLSRNGNRYVAPEWFTRGLPDTPLDGELWVGRKQLQRTVSIVRRSEGSELWREVHYLLFDAPALAQPFEQRLASVKKMLATNQPSYAVELAQSVCRSEEHLTRELTHIEALGGEGLMLRQPASLYEPRRSSTLLKVKSFVTAKPSWSITSPGRAATKADSALCSSNSRTAFVSPAAQGCPTRTIRWIASTDPLSPRHSPCQESKNGSSHEMEWSRIKERGRNHFPK